MSHPQFRAPWTHGAAAYFEADTFDAAREGFKRKRKPVLFHMPNTGEAGDKPCVHCGGLLREPARAVTRAHGNGVRSEQDAAKTPDKWSSWYYDPKSKSIVGGRHYICSWSSLLGALHSSTRY